MVMSIAKSTWRAGVGGDEAENSQGSENSQNGDEDEGEAPAGCLANQGTEGDPCDVGHREAGEHHGNGSGPALGCDQAGGDHRSDAEEGSVGEGGQDPAGQEQGKVRCGRAQGVARDEDQHEQREHRFAGSASAQQGHDGRADEDADGVGGDQISGRGNGDAEGVRHLGQEAGGHELGGAYAEGTDGQCQKGQGHGVS
jgi:hypothetical protein